MTWRGRLLALAVALGVLLGAHALIWFWGEAQLRAGWDAWVADRRAAGWRVEAGEPVRAGWPLAAGLALPAVLVQGDDTDIPGGFAWRAERVLLHVPLLHPRLLEVTAEGQQHGRLGRSPEVGYTADQLRMDIPLDTPAPANVVDLTGAALRAGIPVGRSVANVSVGLLRIRAEFRPDARAGEPAVSVAGSADAIELPSLLPQALGTRISALSVEGVASGPVPSPRPPAERAAAWRDGGGTVDVKRWALGWGPLGAAGNGKLFLDGGLQPAGTGQARVVGYSEALDALARGGVISAGAALATKAVAGLIASAPANGGPPEVELTLTLRDRTLSARQIPLARLPPVNWPPS